MSKPEINRETKQESPHTGPKETETQKRDFRLHNFHMTGVFLLYHSPKFYNIYRLVTIYVYHSLLSIHSSLRVSITALVKTGLTEMPSIHPTPDTARSSSKNAKERRRHSESTEAVTRDQPAARSAKSRPEAEDQ